ncbi:MAG: KTSC domain-containing protein [Acidobacteriota bacterium]
MKSTAVEAIGYDEGLQELHVWWKSGRHHAFLEVPPEVFDELWGTRSVGGYFNTVIKQEFEVEERD